MHQHTYIHIQYIQQYIIQTYVYNGFDKGEFAKRVREMSSQLFVTVFTQYIYPSAPFPFREFACMYINTNIWNIFFQRNELDVLVEEEHWALERPQNKIIDMIKPLRPPRNQDLTVYLGFPAIIFLCVILFALGLFLTFCFYTIFEI